MGGVVRENWAGISGWTPGIGGPNPLSFHTQLGEQKENVI